MKLKAAAKINLGLAIEKKLTKGFHRVKLVNCQVSLFDEITLKTRTDGKIKTALGKNNTIVKAVALLRREYKINQGLEIQLKKNIPIACGLAGGSSDAAMALKALNKLWQLGLSTKQLISLSTKIGLDVAYQLTGGVQLETQGSLRGSKFLRLPDLPETEIVLCGVGKKISTAWAYDQIKVKALKSLANLIQAIKKNDIVKIGASLHNDFEPVVHEVCPETKKIKEILLQHGALGASITGKGPMSFGIFADKIKAKQAVTALSKKYPQVYLCIPEKKLG